MAKLLSINKETEIKKKLFGFSDSEAIQSLEFPSDGITCLLGEIDIQNQINDIWKRVGNDLKTKGFAEDKIDFVINEVR